MKKRSTKEINSSLLHTAVSKNRPDLIKRLLETEVYVDSKSPVYVNQLEPLSLALKLGHYEIAKLLLDAKADVNLRSRELLPIAHALANKNCPLSIVKDIIAAGFSPDQHINTETRETCLHYAVKMKNNSVAKYLSDIVNVNAQNAEGSSPLHYAVKANSLVIVKVLVDKGAKMDLEDKCGMTPMLCAIADGNLEMVRMCLVSGANIAFRSEKGLDPMMPLHFAVKNFKPKIVTCLIEKGADVNQTIDESSSETPLAQAIMACETIRDELNMINIIQLLVSQGADVNHVSTAGLTPLQLAIQKKKYGLAKALINHGGNLNDKFKQGGHTLTTFQAILCTLNMDLIKTSLNHGADWSLQKQAYTLKYPPHLCLVLAWRDEKDMFEDHYRSLLKLFWKTGFGYKNSEYLETIISSVMSPEESELEEEIHKYLKNQRLLFYGVMKKRKSLVIHALTEGATCHNYGHIKMPFGALYHMASHGLTSIMKMFLNRACLPVNDIVMFETVLHEAARKGSIDCCYLLLENGAVYDFKSHNMLSQTPLEVAKDFQQSEVVNLLTTVHKYFKAVKNGHFRKLKPDVRHFKAVMNCRNHLGRTLMEEAIVSGHTKIAERLMMLRCKFLNSKTLNPNNYRKIETCWTGMDDFLS